MAVWHRAITTYVTDKLRRSRMLPDTLLHLTSHYRYSYRTVSLQRIITYTAIMLGVADDCFMRAKTEPYIVHLCRRDRVYHLTNAQQVFYAVT